ncbi:hypothetical protein ACFQFC_21315 [Amorphoplanes digitatis]|uniref:Uncharacterized protein n=1 Tax=Actinoplanes digitatis TaxID=1868 RepID=A0A7W7I5N9_9ACTN|nr:hypothetical protein [Actinoplanes digitatis]MBB4766756.1 hypothetical protein [Actinoplanes digitatis]GID96638.1 hypothetical protein Adi01nite_60500 [Actinoplanes digitatis]
MKRKILLRLSLPAVAVLLAPLAAAPAFAAAPAAPTITQVGTTAVIGQTTKFKFTEADGSEPAEYHWMINGGELTGTAIATDGKATAKILSTRAFNQLQVYAVGADGSVGDDANVLYAASDPAAYADQDLDGDGRPDLAAVVGETLLEADGKGTGGKVRVPAIDLAPDGNGVGGTFAGLQLITGKFRGGPFEDYFAYRPSDGYAFIYDGLGEADQNNPGLVAKHEHTVSGGMFSDWDGNNPTQLVNAYDAAGAHQSIPDLLGVLGNAESGYHLEYYVSFGWGTGFYQSPVDTTASTPDGGSDWENWQLATKLLPSGTAVSLWNPSTGALYLWEGVTFDSESGRLSYTQYKLSANFLTGANGTTLRLTDFDADGVADIWGVSAGSVTAYQVSGLSQTGTAKIKAKAPQPLA